MMTNMIAVQANRSTGDSAEAAEFFNARGVRLCSVCTSLFVATRLCTSLSCVGRSILSAADPTYAPDVLDAMPINSSCRELVVVVIPHAEDRKKPVRMYPNICYYERTGVRVKVF
jgi:hypothetical protein